MAAVPVLKDISPPFLFNLSVDDEASIGAQLHSRLEIAKGVQDHEWQALLPENGTGRWKWIEALIPKIADRTQRYFQADEKFPFSIVISRNPQNADLVTDLFINFSKARLCQDKGGFQQIQKALSLTRAEIVARITPKRAFFTECPDTQYALQEIRGRGVVSALEPPIPLRRFEGGLMFYSELYDGDIEDAAPQFSFPEKVEIARQLLQGLVTLSSHGAHRDLHPANLLFRKLKSGSIQAGITDWQTFRKLSDINPSKEQMRREDFNAFSPPETIREKIHTKKSDVWQMGISLHYLFRGKYLPWIETVRETGEIAHLEWVVPNLKPGWIEKYCEGNDSLIPFLSAMLNPSMEDRITASEALHLFERQFPQKS